MSKNASKQKNNFFCHNFYLEALALPLMDDNWRMIGCERECHLWKIKKNFFEFFCANFSTQKGDLNNDWYKLICKSNKSNYFLIVLFPGSTQDCNWWTLGGTIEIVVNLELTYNNNKTGLQPVSRLGEPILVFFPKGFKKGLVQRVSLIMCGTFGATTPVFKPLDFRSPLYSCFR